MLLTLSVFSCHLVSSFIVGILPTSYLHTVAIRRIMGQSLNLTQRSEERHGGIWGEDQKSPSQTGIGRLPYLLSYFLFLTGTVRPFRVSVSFPPSSTRYVRVKESGWSVGRFRKGRRLPHLCPVFTIRLRIGRNTFEVQGFSSIVVGWVGGRLYIGHTGLTLDKVGKVNPVQPGVREVLY